ncbi:MAG: hypothetical protein CM15mP130_2870 [Verrucomicrobiota bacterium]|nr:MAG: hypothetical protein CM15mP130_2870 [Verrucomicrobiota bacterium]
MPFFCRGDMNDWVGCLKTPPLTPNIDKLAKSGENFQAHTAGFLAQSGAPFYVCLTTGFIKRAKTLWIT